MGLCHGKPIKNPETRPDNPVIPGENDPLPRSQTGKTSSFPFYSPSLLPSLFKNSPANSSVSSTPLRIFAHFLLLLQQSTFEHCSLEGKELRLLWLKIEVLGRGLRRPWRVREAEVREEGFGELSGEDEREEERRKEKRKKK
jgi:hypothetical protein